MLHESVDPQTVLSLVGAGVGVSALPRSLSGAPREDVAFVTLDRFLALLEDVTEVWHRETFRERLRSR